MDLEGPSIFGGYRLSSRIATGGMAEVYLARPTQTDGSLGHAVALKRLLPHLVRDANVVRMFLNEARITAQIHHENVVRIVDIGHQDGEPFIAMELLEGRSFAEVRQKAAMMGERVPLGITLRVLTDACRGLGAAHRAVDPEGNALSIVHRDFSPDNIHVGIRGDVKVIDFGIAKAENLGSGTEPGTLKGKFYYMSPEMILGRPVDHRADLFAAGVMLYEQLCGRRPFTGETTDQVLNRIAEGKPRRPTEFDPSVPAELEQICLTALSRNPDQRFPTLEEFITAIEAVGGRGVLASREDVGRYVTRLFPDDDPKRQALRLAMAADPSNPSAQLPASVRDRPRTPRPSAPAQPVTRRSSGEHPTRVDRRGPAVEGAAIRIPAAPNAPEGAPPAPRRPLPVKAMAIAAGVALVAGGAGLVLLRPTPPPAEQLAKAKALPAEERGSVLSSIAEDARATADELAAAASLAGGEPLLKLAEALRRRFPEDARGPLLEARAAVELRYAKRAEEAIEAARKVNPTTAEPDALLAELRAAQGDLSAALTAYAKARSRDRSDPALAAKHGRLLSQSNQLEEAAEALGVALQKAFDADVAAELAFVRFRQDRAGDARALLTRAAKKAPDNFTVRYYLGAVLFRQGDVAGAVREYREADRLAPEDPRALAALCEVQAKGGKPKDAEETRKLLAERFPAQAAALSATCVP